jgi:uncharacterized membrane protein YedE/YeeE
MSPDFTPLQSTIGGILIGLSASLLLLMEGRIAGISGIVGGILAPKPGELGWRVAFVLGLLIPGGVALFLKPELVRNTLATPIPVLILAGLLVGFGTQLGNGCTSGHGVCGLSRLSRRSLASVMMFMGVGMLTAVLAAEFMGGH